MVTVLIVQSLRKLHMHAAPNNSTQLINFTEVTGSSTSIIDTPMLPSIRIFPSPLHPS